MATWDGFDNRIIANRQKDTYIHGFLDISGTFKSQSLLTSFDLPVLQQYAANTTVKSYTSNNPAYTGTYQIDGLTGQGNAIISVSNVAGGVAFAGNSSIITSSNLLALGANVAVPKYANIAINVNVPVGTNLTFNANIANVFYTAATTALSSNIVLNATTNANIGNITLFQTQDYLKANCSYKTADAITIPLGMSVTGSLGLNTNLPGITNAPSNPVVYAANNNSYTVLAFTSVGSYNLQFNNNTQIGYLVVGGGGAGGAVNATGTTSGGGGGGGGISYGTISQGPTIMTAGTNYTITVGAGGIGIANSAGSSGGTSSIIGGSINISCTGGGGGGVGGGSAGTAGTSGTSSGGYSNNTGGLGGAGRNAAAVGLVGNAPSIGSFFITDICANAFQLAGGAPGGSSNTPTGGANGNAGTNGIYGSGGGSGTGTSNNGGVGAYSIFNSSNSLNTANISNTNVSLSAVPNTGAGGGGYTGQTGTIGAGNGGSGVVYIYFTTANSTPAVFSNITYRSAPANSTSITQTPVTVANITVPPFYSGNALSVYVPIAANIQFAPSTNYNLNNGITGNTISFLTTINNVYANIYQNTTATSYSNITLTPNITSNIYITNGSTAPIYFGANITNSAAPTTLQIKQYLYTANITFTPAYSTLINNYLINMYSSGNIVGSNATVNSAAVNAGLLGNIEYNSITYSGNVNATVAGSVTGNYQAGNVKIGGNYSSGSIYSMGLGSYSGNVLFVNSYNTVKPNIQITYAPNIYLVNSVNTLQYSLNSNDYANNYIKTIQVPDLDTSVTSLNTNYTANIVLGNINIPQNNSNIFANIKTTDFHSLITVGNLKVTVNNFPTANTIANITTYANPPFNTSTGSGIFANSLTTSLNTVNFSGYNALSGNISLSKTFLNYNVTLANVTIMDQFLNNTTGNVTGSTTSGVSYTVNGTSGQITSPTVAITYSNIAPGQTYTMADFIGNVVLAGVYLPTTNPTTSTGIYTPCLSLVGNITAPYTTTIVNANVFSNIVAATSTSGFLGTNIGTNNVNIIDNNTTNNNSVGSSGATSSYVQGLPSLSGNVYANHMTTNNLTVAGQLNVRQYSAQNIIATTTTTYNQLTVNEDLSLNGRLTVSGNVGIGTTNPQAALDIVGNISLNGNLTLANNGNLIIGNNNFATTISPNSSAALANTWSTTVNGQIINWNSSASSVYPNAAYVAYKPFDGSVTTTWASSNSNLYSNTGDYPTTGPSNTLNINNISGVSSLSGEWLQIYTGGIPLILSNYNLGAGQIVQVPKVYYILGSNDNTNWYGIHKGSLSAAPTTAYSLINTVITQQGTSYSSYGGSGTLTITVYSGAANSYKYFRIAIPSIFSTTGTSVAELSEWNINFTTPSSSSCSLYLDRLAQNKLNAMVGTTNALVVDSSGYVGIGTTTPIVPLDVNGFIRGYKGFGTACGNVAGVANGTTSVFHTFRGGHAIVTASQSGTQDRYGVWFVYWIANFTTATVIIIKNNNITLNIDSGNLNLTFTLNYAPTVVWNILYLSAPSYNDGVNFIGGFS